MKKLIFTLLIGSLIQGISYGQSSEITVKSIKKGEEPQAVMAAIKRDFPKASTQGELKCLPNLLYNEEWEITENMNGNENDYDYITVLLKEGNETYKAVYDKTGKILHTKTIIKEADLPAAIIKTINDTYPGYSIVNDREKISSDKNRNLDVVYRVEIQRWEKGKTKSLFLNSNGEILREVGHINL